MKQKTVTNNNHLLNVAQAAQFLGVHVGTIRRWARSNLLSGLKVGIRGDWRFSKEDLLKMVKSNGNKNVEKIL